MRCHWGIRGAITTLALVVAAGVADSRSSSAAGARCHRTPPQSNLSLPAPVVVTTNCARFRIDTSGRVTYLGPRRLPVPRKALAYWADLTWYGFERGHLVVGRGHRQLWRSRRHYAGANPVNVGAVVLGARELAFTYYAGRRSRLYLARYGLGERLVTRGETPLTFLRSGELVSWRDRSRALVLRAGSGRLERVIAPYASDAALDRRSGGLVFRAGDRLGVFDGAVVRELGGLRALGVRGMPVIEPLGGLVAVHDRRRLAVLDYDGRLVASTALPARQQPADGVSSSVAANGSGTMFAFTATRGNTANGSTGQQTIYLLGDGEQQARPVFSEQLDFNVCERIADIAWQGRWLLYSDSERHAAVVDSSLRETPTELSDLIARLPGSGGDGFFDVSWSVQR